MRSLAVVLLCAGCASGNPEVRGQFLGYLGERLLLWHDGLPNAGEEGLDPLPLAAGEDPYWLRIGDTLRAELGHDGGLRGVRRTGTEALPKDFVPGGHPFSGQLVRVDDDGIVIDHGPIPGVMPAMVMPFDVRPALLAGLSAGDRVEGLLYVADRDYWVVSLHRVAAGSVALRTDIAPVQTAGRLPAIDLPVAHGSPVRLGVGQGVATALTFVYTRCPDPDFCPATTLRLQSLQAALPPNARIVTVTLDPDFDTLPVLAEHGGAIGADPARWQLGRLTGEDLRVLALRSGMDVTVEEGRIVHAIRMLVLDPDGHLIERYDDNHWPLDRVVGQLGKGVPMADPGTLGTRYPQEG